MPGWLHRFLPWTILATTTLSFAPPLAGQRITGQIRGTISDSSLADLPGVTVELTSGNIIGTRTVVTTSRGRYRFITLPPGFYDLRFRHPGFETEELRHVPVVVGTTTRKNVTLQLGSMAEILDVKAASTTAARVGLSPSDARLGRLNASKRSEGQEVAPISIAALDATELENRTMYDLSDLADFTPNLEFATASDYSGASNNASVFIRGAGQSDSRLFFDPGVGIYLDGVYLARVQGAVLSLVDVEVVEVLRGPQGTLFGKNTLGGAISIVTRKPGSDLAGHVELTAGSFDRLNGSARVSGRLAPSFFGSLSAASTHANGFTRSLVTSESYNDDNTDSARAAGRWQVSDSVTVDWTADGSRERERGAAAIMTGFQPFQDFVLPFYNEVLTLAGGQPYDERWVTGNLRESYVASPSFAESGIWGTSLDVHGMLRTNLSVRSITSYRQLGLAEAKDPDGSPNEVLEGSSKADQRQWSQEVWLSGLSVNGRLTWILGGFYFEEHSYEEHHQTVFGDLRDALEAVYPGFPFDSVFSLVGSWIWEASTRNYALFSEATLDLSDRLALTTGLRYSHEKKELFFQKTIPARTAAAQPFSNPVEQVFSKESWDPTTARVNLTFQATPDVMLYLAAASGFKSGGFGTEDAFQYELFPYAPERVWSYEVGSKTDLFSNRLRIHAAIFWSDYTDLQLSVFPSGVSAPGHVGNAGQAEVKGFEIGLQARLSDNFRIDAGVGHIDAAYTHLEDVVIGPTLDGTLPRTPEWNLVFSPEYVFRLREGGAVVLHADYTYKTNQFFDAANLSSQGAYGLVNARASFILPSGAWEAYAYGTNLGDQEYKEHGYEYANSASLAVAGRPREWGIGLKYRF